MKKINKLMIIVGLMMVLMVSMVSAVTLNYGSNQGTIGSSTWIYFGVFGRTSGTGLIYDTNVGNNPCGTFTTGADSQSLSGTNNFCIYDSGISYYIEIIEYDGSHVTYNIVEANTAPVINYMTPSNRIELRNGMSQLFSANVTDNEADASYSWDLDGTVVSTSSTFLADYDNIESGIYTLTLTVDDGTYSDSISNEFEVRAKGGAATSPAPVEVTKDVVKTDNSFSVLSKDAPSENIFTRFIDWIKGLFK